MPVVNSEYYVEPELLERRVNVVVVGAGGSGSHVIAHLAVLHQSMVDLGHPEGIHCTVIDSDEVSQANVGRAKFFHADIGCKKALAIVNRVNLCFGLSWEAVDLELTEDCRDSSVRDADIVIGCVDTRKSRRAIRAVLAKHASKSGTLWLDLGNSADDGQVILGEAGTDRVDRLPCVTDLYPEMLDESQDPEDEGPSCSRAGTFASVSLCECDVCVACRLFAWGAVQIWEGGPQRCVLRREEVEGDAAGMQQGGMGTVRMEAQCCEAVADEGMTWMGDVAAVKNRHWDTSAGGYTRAQVITQGKVQPSSRGLPLIGDRHVDHFLCRIRRPQLHLRPCPRPTFEARFADPDSDGSGRCTLGTHAS